MNSPPLLWTHRVGCGYRASHDYMNLLRMCNDALLSTQTNLTRLDAVSMDVNALNLSLRQLNFQSKDQLSHLQPLPKVQCILRILGAVHNCDQKAYAFGSDYT